MGGFYDPAYSMARSMAQLSRRVDELERRLHALETPPPEDVATTPTADGEVSKAAQPLQTTEPEPESDHCQTSEGEA